MDMDMYISTSSGDFILERTICVCVPFLYL